MACPPCPPPGWFDVMKSSLGLASTLLSLSSTTALLFTVTILSVLMVMILNTVYNVYRFSKFLARSWWFMMKWLLFLGVWSGIIAIVVAICLG